MPPQPDPRSPTDARYRAVFEHAGDAMFLMADAGGRYVDVNPAGCALLGYSREELLTLSAWDVIAPWAVPQGQQMWDAFKAGGHLAGEFTVFRKDGSAIPVEFNAVANVCPDLHLIIARDITERARQAERLRTTEEKYRNLLAYAPLVLFTLDAEGRFTEFEGPGLDAVGLHPEDAIGRSALEMYGDVVVQEPSGHQVPAREVLQRVLGGEVIHGSVERNGRVFECSYLPLPDPSANRVMVVAYDVTERHRAAEALRANEERFRRVVENISDVITVLDSEGVVQYVSPSIRRVLGIQPHELVGKSAFDYVHPDDRSAVRLAFDPTRTDVVVRRFRIRHLDGTWRVVEAMGQAHDAGAGGRIVVVASRDLTERERGYAESHLLQDVSWLVAQAPDFNSALASVMRLSCEAYRWVFAEAWVLAQEPGWLELSPVWYSADVRHEVFRQARDARRLPIGTGLPGRACEQKRPVWFTDVTEHPDFQRHEHARLAGLQAALALPIAVDGDGTVAAVLVLYGAHAEEENSRLVGLFSSVSAQLGTVMQRKRAESALAQTRAAMQSVAANAPIVVFALDQRGIFTLLEGAGLKGLGIQPGQHVGRSVLELADDLPEVTSQMRRALAGEAFSGMVEARGRTFQVWYSPQFDVTGALREVLGVATDLTERRQLEEQLRQAQKLESVGLLAGGIAHDFNNMLTAISGYAELVLDDLPPGSPLRDEVREIGRAAERAALLTYQLLAFSRKQILHPRTLDLNEVVADVGRMLQRLIGEHISLVVRPAEGLGLVHADPGQISQVVLNLVVNARDAMPHGGTVTIETRNVELDEAYVEAHRPVEPGSYVMLAVSDTGIGMPPDVRDRVFEPFFTTKDVGRGTGMGLPTVYGIVKQSGGYIWVYSELGHGSTFKTYLPRVGSPEPGLQAAADEPAFACGRETILLVEDEAVVRRLARRALESCGYTVLEAADGAAALEVYDTCGRHVHLLITDVVMPKMNGRELVERLASRPRPPRFLYMSGYTDDAIVHHGILSEGTHFIQKPFSMRALTQRVREVLDE